MDIVIGAAAILGTGALLCIIITRKSDSFIHAVNIITFFLYPVLLQWCMQSVVSAEQDVSEYLDYLVK